MLYKIIAEHDDEEFQKQVNRALNEDWELRGDLSLVAPVIDGSPSPLYCQAMVKDDVQPGIK